MGVHIQILKDTSCVMRRIKDRTGLSILLQVSHINRGVCLYLGYCHEISSLTLVDNCGKYFYVFNNCDEICFHRNLKILSIDQD